MELEALLPVFSQTCHGVTVEPPSQPVVGESYALRGMPANNQEGACSDIVANGFWGVHTRLLI